MTLRELLARGVVAAISVIALIVSLQKDFWGLFGDDPLRAALASLGVALLVVFYGERIALGIRMQATESILSRLGKEIEELQQSFPCQSANSTTPMKPSRN